MDGSSQTVSPRRKRLLTASFLLAIVAFCASSAFGAAPDAADTSLTDFPRLAGETDDAPRLQRAIDATKGGVLYLPRGDYDIASTLVISNRCSLLMHRSATLRAVAEMDYVLRVRHQGVWDHLDFLCFIQGGAIDGSCGLNDLLVVRHISGKLLVADGAIVKTARNFKVYKGCGTVKWRDMMYSGFSSGDSTPGAAAFGE